MRFRLNTVLSGLFAAKRSIMTNIRSPEQRRYIMQAVKTKDTDPEVQSSHMNACSPV